MEWTLTGKSQIGLQILSVSLTFTFAFRFFGYYNHIEWPASGNPAPLPVY